MAIHSQDEIEEEDEEENLGRGGIGRKLAFIESNNINIL